MNEIREQMRWLREGVAGGHAIAIADTMEKMLAVVEAALWLNEVNGTPERNMELIQAAFAKLNEELAALNDGTVLEELEQ